MPDLIEGSVPLKIQYAVSLPHSLFSAASLICAVSEYEGLGDWLREARALLPADLRSELSVLMTFPGRYQRFTEDLAATFPPGALDWRLGDLLSHLESLTDADYRCLALSAIAKPGGTLSPADLLDLAARPREWAAHLTAVGIEAPPGAVAALVLEPETLKSSLVTVARRFWEEVYAAEFEVTRPLMERSVLQHRAARYGSDFRDVFVAVTGRLLPESIAALLPGVRAVTFIPSCYVGPYVAYLHLGSELVLFYNCRSAAAAVDLPTVRSAALYPPLNALADETRLQILALLRDRELYAQEIVDRLHISQPAVSRHLNLMVAAGVLNIRREGNAKYYAINRDVLADLARALSSLV
jgi:hypothetical protein